MKPSISAHMPLAATGLQRKPFGSLHAKTLLAALTASAMLAGSATAAVVVNHQIQGTPLHTVQGTLLAVDSPTTQGGNIVGPGGPDWPVDADDGFRIGSGVTLVPEGNRLGWEPDGTAAGTGVGARQIGYLNNPAAGSQVSWTFDIPDGSIVHGVYSHWLHQGNSGAAHTIGYDEGTPTSILRPARNSFNNLVLGWTDSASTVNNRNFERLFAGDITVAGGDGFRVTFTKQGTGVFPYIDAVVIDYTTIPEPSTALLGGIGFLALILRRRR